MKQNLIQHKKKQSWQTVIIPSNSVKHSSSYMTNKQYVILHQKVYSSTLIKPWAIIYYYTTIQINKKRTLLNLKALVINEAQRKVTMEAFIQQNNAAVCYSIT